MFLAVRFAALFSLVAAQLVVEPGLAMEACTDLSLTPTHRLDDIPTLPTGTVRPVVRLIGLQGTEPIAVLVEGVILPAKVGEVARTAYADAMTSLRDRPVMFTASADASDRHGRLRGTIWLMDGGSVGERLLAAGAGIADVAFAPCATRFLTAEAMARAEKRGIWRQSRIWTDLNAAATDLPDFVLGRGRVASIGRSGRTTYINFGGNFRTDATVRLREAMTSALVAAGQPPEQLSGRMIEVRGWAKQRDGLDMELESPLALRPSDETSNLTTD